MGNMRKSRKGRYTRRDFLAGSAASFIGVRPTLAASDRIPGIGLSAPSGWSTLRVGAGGLITGFDFADDRRMLIRCDTFGVYLWEAPANTGVATYETVNNPSHYWRQLQTLDSLRNAVSGGFKIESTPIPSVAFGGYDACFAPSNSSRILMVCGDLTSQATAVRKSGVYITDDAGSSWRMVNDRTNFPTFINAWPNGAVAQKASQNKLAIDPNNQNIMYAGMPYKSGNTHPVYRSTDGGKTWSGAWCSGVISTATADPGANCMVFDRSSGTATAFGQTVTKRMLFGVNGVGMYETFDGGVSWTLTTGGPTSFYTQDTDYDGRVYVTVTAWTDLWRYDPGASAGTGTWYQVSAGRRFPGGMSGMTGAICCDKRNGGQGKLWMSRNLLHGYYSANAQSTTIDDITWVGSAGSPAGSYNPAPNDLPWSVKSRRAQDGCFNIRCDANGVVWMAGTQNFWYCDMPIYANGTSRAPVVANSVGRGIEQTVTGAVLRAPGSPYILCGMLDVGLYRKSEIDAYPSPSDWIWNGEIVKDRLDCTGLEFSRHDPAFVVTKAQSYQARNAGTTLKFSSYSRDNGVTWTRYSAMPDSLYPEDHAVNGGYILAFDADRHLCIVGDTQAFKPCYTSNATSSSCSWALCGDLPNAIWLGRGGLPNYKSTHPFDADHVLPGVAYAYNYETSDIWRTTNYGVNWSVVGNRPMGIENKPYLYTVPGRAGHFYLTSQYSVAVGKLYKYVNGGVDRPTEIPLPHRVGSVFQIALGKAKPGNPHAALYLIGWNGHYSQFSLWRSDAGDGSDWVQFGGILENTLPSLNQLDAPRIFAGDWVDYGRVYLGSWGSGFSVFSL